MTRKDIRHIAESNFDKLKEISQTRKDWFIKTLNTPFFTRKDNLVCPFCSAEFSKKKGKCPHCRKKVEKIADNNRKYKRKYAYSFFQIVKGVQVQRTYEVNVYFQRDKEVDAYFFEVCQSWFTTPHNVVRVARPTFMYNWTSSPLTVRRNATPSNMQYDYENCSDVYPKGKVLPFFQRYGLHSFGQLNDAGRSNNAFMFDICKDNKLETLLKLKQYPLLRGLRNYEIDTLWQQIRLVLRHNYPLQTKDVVVDWKDTIDLLKYHNMDIHNPIYVCPDDLKGLHDRLLERKRVIEQRKARERARLEKMKKAERDRIAQEKYIKRMKKYFDLIISNEQINIVPLKSVQEFYQEGNTLHHCVGQMRYYEKADTLILSARIDNKPIETIEINLTDLSIVQCRGKYNKNSEYHDIILDMVKDNINKIRTIKRRKAVA